MKQDHSITNLDFRRNIFSDTVRSWRAAIIFGGFFFLEGRKVGRVSMFVSRERVLGLRLTLK
jgi:hypothetical protein